MLFSILVLAIAVGGYSASAPERDSLQTLKRILSNELEGRNKVLILKDKSFSDSLLRMEEPPERSAFDRLLDDTARVVEMKGRKDFLDYWKQIEERNGYKELQAQYSAQDIDRARIPKLFLFDSSVVIYPGWIILKMK